MRPVVRKGLTKAKILEAAATLVDGGGPAALTMRALSARLAVAPMALYNHFRDRDAILDALADSVFARLREQAREASARSKTNWKRQLKRLILSTQQLADQHPHLFRVAFTRPDKPPSAFALTVDAIDTLRRAGLSARQAGTAYHAFVILLQGYPFWQEGTERHGASMAVPGWTTQRQFEAIVDWLLACVAATAAK
jgi:AcrR family transcriptional regulator